IQVKSFEDDAIDISGWKIGGAVDFTFKPGTIIAPQKYIYVSPNVNAFRARTTSPKGGQGLYVQGNYSGHLNAWGETVTLTDNLGNLVATNTYTGNPSLAQQFLRVTEIMYNPSPATNINSDAQQFEYIELKNISTTTNLNLNGVRFTNGIAFNFTDSAVTNLLPGQYVLLVRNQAAFAARYPTNTALIAGQFSGTLDNAGETLRLEDAVGEKILEFAYNNSWYPVTDGLGFSLVIVNELAPWDTWDKKSSWRASGALDGSPGMDDALSGISPILINEALTHTDLPQHDSIELYNPNANTANIGGWFLTDDKTIPKKFRIPNGTTIPASGFAVFDDSQFDSGPNAFRLSEYGEDVYVFSGDANTNLTGYSHGYSFDAAPNGISFGRYIDSTGDDHFVLQSTNSLGATNNYPRVGPIVVSEIMYHP